jgi:hypothetical protein
MARKAGQIIARGANTWLVRVYLGRDPQTGTRKSRAAVMSLNQLLTTVVKARVRVRTFRDHETLLRILKLIAEVEFMPLEVAEDFLNKVSAIVARKNG